MAFAHRARIDVAGIYSRFSSLERRAIDGGKRHLFTSRQGSIFSMETPIARSRACFRARMGPKDGAKLLYGSEPANSKRGPTIGRC